MDNKLKPCPFCGKAPEESERADNNTCTGRAYFVACMCGGYSANAHQFGETKEEVVSKWNRRAYAEQLERERDELRRELTESRSREADLRSGLGHEKGRIAVLERERDALKQKLSQQPVGAVVEAEIIAAHEFVTWNRGSEGEQAVEVTKELFVAFKVIELYKAALAAQTPAQQSGGVVVEGVNLYGGYYLKREQKTTGENGWLLFASTGRLVRALNGAECELVDCALAAAPSPEAQGE